MFLIKYIVQNYLLKTYLYARIQPFQKVVTTGGVEPRPYGFVEFDISCVKQSAQKRVTTERIKTRSLQGYIKGVISQCDAHITDFRSL